MSLVNWGGNSRYLQIDPAKAVKVPKKVDPVSTVCLAETYLSAYQILFHGILGTRRQRKASLRGRSYMLFGSIDRNFASAIAKYAGVKAIYAGANKKHFQHFRKLGIVPFDQEHNDLTKGMKGMIDRIVSFDHDASQFHSGMLDKREILLSSTAPIARRSLMDCQSYNRICFAADPDLSNMGRPTTTMTPRNGRNKTSGVKLTFPFSSISSLRESSLLGYVIEFLCITWAKSTKCLKRNDVPVF